MKTTKKLLSAIIIFCVVMLLCGCSAGKTEIYPPFFEITHPDYGSKAYLLGTMHVGTAKSVYPRSIYQALDRSSALAVEVDLIELDNDQKRVNKALKLLECQGETARQFMGDDYEEIKGFFKKINLYSGAFDHYIPAMWSAQLSNRIAADCGYKARYGTDREMLAYAKKNGITIIELESVEQQYSVNAAEPRALQVYSLLEAARCGYDEQQRQLRELYTAWSTNDGAALKAMLDDQDIPGELAEDYAEYYKAMYTDRQRKMANYIASQIESGNTVFTAVGAMHCYAEPSILDFLEEKGFVISEVYGHENVE